MDNPPGKMKAVIAYFTFIGLLIAYFMNRDEKDAFATWHIKNMFGLLLGLFASVWLQNYAIGFYVYWTIACLWFLSLLMAVLGKQQAIPYLSEKFQDWFKFLD